MVELISWRDRMPKIRVVLQLTSRFLLSLLDRADEVIE
jgi:hypothetical protein